jgi:hypothetical protein
MFSSAEQISLRMVHMMNVEINNKIREVEKMKHFKRELKPYLLQHTFYSVEEYMSS